MTEEKTKILVSLITTNGYSCVSEGGYVDCKDCVPKLHYHCVRRNINLKLEIAKEELGEADYGLLFEVLL